MITLQVYDDTVVVSRDYAPILDAHKDDFPGIICDLADCARPSYTPEESREMLRLLAAASPGLTAIKCAHALRKLNEIEARASRIAALEAERDALSSFVEEILPGEDGWSTGQHIAMARIALESRDEAGDRRISTLRAGLVGLIRADFTDEYIAKATDHLTDEQLVAFVRTCLESEGGEG